jgi:hypothetical protein
MTSGGLRARELEAARAALGAHQRDVAPAREDLLRQREVGVVVLHVEQQVRILVLKATRVVADAGHMEATPPNPAQLRR